METVADCVSVDAVDTALTALDVLRSMLTAVHMLPGHGGQAERCGVCSGAGDAPAISAALWTAQLMHDGHGPCACQRALRVSTAAATACATPQRRCPLCLLAEGGCSG